MQLCDIKETINSVLYDCLEREGIKELRPCQDKAIKAGVFEGKNLLVCTPTASGKTKVAEFAIINSILENKGKAVYIVPLKALATEKYKQFKKHYGELINIKLSIGDLDSSDPYLGQADLIICTSEKLDSLIRHKVGWIKDLSVVVIDEIHLLNDASRGPTLEILITMLKMLVSKIQLIALSATIGNEEELANWLDAILVHDTWRPVKLEKGIYEDGEIEFY